MGAKKTGLSRELLIHPGETLADVLEDRNISQAELAFATGVSEAFISKVISGKNDISARFAAALDCALGIPKSFWLNLQKDYCAELAEVMQVESITDEERECARELKDVLKHFRKEGIVPARLSIDEKVLALRKVLHINDLTRLINLVPTGQFRLAEGNGIKPTIFGAWLRLAQLQTEGTVGDHKFTSDDVPALVAELKDIMLNALVEDYQTILQQVFARFGIAFAIVKNFKGAPVQGYVTVGANGTLRMAVTIRGSWEDVFWFSVLHEVGHIVNGDVDRRKGDFFDNASDYEKEERANSFARDALINPGDYERFIDEGDFALSSIRRFAVSQNVAPGIVVGRLQKEGHMPWERFSSVKRRLKWED